MIEPGETPAWLARRPKPLRALVWTLLGAWIGLSALIFFVRYCYLLVLAYG